MANKENPKAETFPNGRLKRTGQPPNLPKEYEGLDVPPPPNHARNEAARSYAVRLGSRTAQILWEPAFKELTNAGIVPGTEIEDMDELSACVLALVSKGHNIKFAVGLLHVGQCTTTKYETIQTYISKNHSEMLDFAQQMQTNKYFKTLESYVYDENMMTKDIQPRAEILKWILAKKDPNQFGNKTNVEHTGRNGGPIETAKVVIHLPANSRIPNIGQLMNAPIPLPKVNNSPINAIEGEIIGANPQSNTMEETENE